MAVHQLSSGNGSTSAVEWYWQYISCRVVMAVHQLSSGNGSTSAVEW